MEEQDQRHLAHVDHFQSEPLAQDTPMEVSRSTSGLAIASLVLGIISVLGAGISFLAPLLAVIFGHIAVGACNKDPKLDGRGMAIAGLVMGWLCLVGWAVFIFLLGGLAVLAAIFASF